MFYPMWIDTFALNIFIHREVIRLIFVCCLCSLGQHHIHQLDSVSCSAPKLIIGYFNGFSLKTYLPTYKQYVTCATRNDKTIDICYCNIKKSCKSAPKPPLGRSDHNFVQLLPVYKQLLKIRTVEDKTATLWNTSPYTCFQV